MDYNSDFEYDLEFGQEFEEELARIFNNSKIECKDESREWKETGNVFIETECRGDEGALEHTESDWWAEKLSDGLIILMKTDRLKEVLEAIKDDKIVKKQKGGDNDKSVGFLVNILRLIRGFREE